MFASNFCLSQRLHKLLSVHLWHLITHLFLLPSTSYKLYSTSKQKQTLSTNLRIGPELVCLESQVGSSSYPCSALRQKLLSLGDHWHFPEYTCHTFHYFLYRCIAFLKNATRSWHVNWHAMWYFSQSTRPVTCGRWGSIFQKKTPKGCWQCSKKTGTEIMTKAEDFLFHSFNIQR